MPIMDGREATRHITRDETLTSTRVIILTTFDLDQYVYEALRGGPSGFLVKDTMPIDLLNAVRVVAAGDALISPRITRRLIEEFAQRPEPATAAVEAAVLRQLTEREREVLALVARGQSNNEISTALFVAVPASKWPSRRRWSSSSGQTEMSSGCMRTSHPWVSATSGTART